jgi:putative (di)nucleoside polyphosphate hydrolase
MTQLPLRPNVCILLCNQAGELLLGERRGEKGIWQFPQGGVEPDSPLEENVIRELHEELGAPKDLFSIVKKLDATHSYDFAKPPAYAAGKWRGQAQTFWLVEFKGKDSDFNLDAHEPEFSGWKWCKPDAVRKMAEPKRLPGYEAPLKEFEEYLRKKTAR